jgi:hypothetical protein
MAENIVINTTPPSNGDSSNGLIGLIRPIAILLIILALVALVYALVIFVDNYEAIATFFTSGFIGWLNPFDDPDGDTGPIDNLRSSGVGVFSVLPIIGPVFRVLLRR